MLIASTPITSPVVDQHPVATTNDEPIVNVDLVALDVVMDVPLRRSERACRPAILDDYNIYLQEHESDVGYVSNLITKKPLLILNLTSGSMQ